MSPPPAVFAELAAEIDAALDAALDERLGRLTALHPLVGPVAEELRAFVSGGKRIRPALLLLGFEGAGGSDRRAVHGPALALELLHTCALAHDDVIDRASTRRGRPSVHQHFATLHRDHGWVGDPGRYGEAVAILLGDLAFVHADEAFLQARVPDRALLSAFRRFAVLREEVMAGQYLDLQTATSRTTDRDLALRVATLKSGRYSVTRPLEIGALLAGADLQLVERLHTFGDPLGRAFQVRDDLLGVFGEEAETGKSAWSDLVEGKRTLLVAEAMDRLEPAGRTLLDRELGNPDLSAERAAALRQLLEVSGARQATEQYVAAAVAEAQAALDDLELASGPAAALRQMATYLGDRAT